MVGKLHRALRLDGCHLISLLTMAIKSFSLWHASTDARVQRVADDGQRYNLWDIFTLRHMNAAFGTGPHHSRCVWLVLLNVRKQYKLVKSTRTRTLMYRAPRPARVLCNVVMLLAEPARCWHALVRAGVHSKIRRVRATSHRHTSVRRQAHATHELSRDHHITIFRDPDHACEQRAHA